MSNRSVLKPGPSQRAQPVYTVTRRLVAAIATAIVLLSSACSADDSNLTFGDGSLQEPDYSFTIPFGSGEQIDAGVPVEILPARLDVKVGEVIHINNEDDRGHLVGPFFVGPNEELSQRFASVGELVGECSVHPSGELTVSVTQ